MNSKKIFLGKYSMKGIHLKLFLILPAIFLIFSCASKQANIIQHKKPDATSADTLSNYFLFEYINSLSGEDYFTKLDSIKNETSADFFTLRMAYTHTKDYFPYASDISDSLKKASQLIDASKYDMAKSILDKIHEKNYVNIPSHLYYGYIYEQLGDTIKSKFHYNIYNGLLNSIYQSGDGILPETAYIVISTKEEYNFLNWFGLQFNSQSLIYEDDYSFDLMEVTDPETDETHEIYFNIELAYDKLRSAFGE